MTYTARKIVLLMLLMLAVSAGLMTSCQPGEPDSGPAYTTLKQALEDIDLFSMIPPSVPLPSSRK